MLSIFARDFELACLFSDHLSTIPIKGIFLIKKHKKRKKGSFSF